MQNHKRALLRGVLAASAAFVKSAESSQPQPAHLINLKKFVDIEKIVAALHETGLPVCEQEAIRLTSLPQPAHCFDLHIRRASLTEKKVKKLALAFSDKSQSRLSGLRSFSASYNPDLTDEGAVVLIACLPQSVTQLGLVSCGLGDKAGNSILQWARSARQLKMLCIEGNQFTTGMKEQFSQLAAQRSSMLVVA